MLTSLQVDKRHYSMKEIHELTGLSNDTLRYYEHEGLLDNIERRSNGHRTYSQFDLEWLRFIICLKSTGMPLKTIKKYRQLMQEGDATTIERKELLLDHRKTIQNAMADLEKALDTINYKINYYRSIEEHLT